ncbi:putative membrane protein YfcA [Methanococcus maripaludis]|uniref:Putative membrane protein YfcA n=1 Tax=Methanococcus maripaludis TaxID=39152 RepID=A0A7J9NWQ2_METMI|nr:hypothetical protein [Methanococcus maripaludis]MBA2851443.1 putative membrane protein YfcA [Methanococcus maripaludis]
MIPMEYTQGIIGSVIALVLNLSYTPQQICLITGVLMLCLATILSFKLKKDFKPQNKKKINNYSNYQSKNRNYQSKSYKKRR